MDSNLKMWKIVEEIITRSRKKDRSCIGDHVLVANHSFVNELRDLFFLYRCDGQYLMFNLRTKCVWSATEPDEKHLVKIVSLTPEEETYYFELLNGWIKRKLTIVDLKVDKISYKRLVGKIFLAENISKSVRCLLVEDPLDTYLIIPNENGGVDFKPVAGIESIDKYKTVKTVEVDVDLIRLAIASSNDQHSAGYQIKELLES